MDIVFRAAAVYLLLWFITRALGKRELGQMSAFELVLLVTMGDLVQQGVTQEDYSVTGAALAVGTFAVLILLFSWVSFRFRGSRRVLEGVPVVVVKDGRCLAAHMRAERLSDTELELALRQQGIERLDHVRLGVLEPDGSFSFFTSEPHGPPRDPPAS